MRARGPLRLRGYPTLFQDNDGWCLAPERHVWWFVWVERERVRRIKTRLRFKRLVGWAARTYVASSTRWDSFIRSSKKNIDAFHRAASPGVEGRTMQLSSSDRRTGHLSGSKYSCLQLCEMRKSGQLSTREISTLLTSYNKVTTS